MVSVLKGEGAVMINKILDTTIAREFLKDERCDVIIRMETPDWELWEHVPRATLIDTVTLSCGINPDEKKSYNFNFNTKQTPINFVEVISLELTRRMRIAEANYRNVDFDGETFNHSKMSIPSIPNREISTHLFYDWAKSIEWELPQRFPKSLANLKVVIQSVYPWGNHNTKLLTKLSEAAIKFWSLYDPTQPDTAPKNEEVSDWLIKEGASKTLAEAMATILRADGLRTGRR
jgi:hypothetical protein